MASEVAHWRETAQQSDYGTIQKLQVFFSSACVAVPVPIHDTQSLTEDGLPIGNRNTCLSCEKLRRKRLLG